MNREEMRKFVWGQVLLLTTEKKNKFRDGKYAAYKEMWEKLGGDSRSTVHLDENASEKERSG